MNITVTTTDPESPDTHLLLEELVPRLRRNGMLVKPVSRKVEKPGTLALDQTVALALGFPLPRGRHRRRRHRRSRRLWRSSSPATWPPLRSTRRSCAWSSRRSSRTAPASWNSNARRCRSAYRNRRRPDNRNRNTGFRVAAAQDGDGFRPALTDCLSRPVRRANCSNTRGALVRASGCGPQGAPRVSDSTRRLVACAIQEKTIPFRS